MARQIFNMLSRGTVTLTNAERKLQTLQIALLSDEAKDTVEHFEPFGFTSNPHPGAEVLTAFIEGDRSHGIVIAATDRRYRVQNLLSGEVAIYDDHGTMIKLTQTGIIIVGGGFPINISGAATVNVAGGTVNVTGGDVTADGISLKGHHHNEHDGPSTSAAIA
ncbi:MAG: phage baseplate assembly protein V [Negativicutes bacterium]